MFFCPNGYSSENRKIIGLNVNEIPLGDYPRGSTPDGFANVYIDTNSWFNHFNCYFLNYKGTDTSVGYATPAKDFEIVRYSNPSLAPAGLAFTPQPFDYYNSFYNHSGGNIESAWSNTSYKGDDIYHPYLYAFTVENMPYHLVAVPYIICCDTSAAPDDYTGNPPEMHTYAYDEYFNTYALQYPWITGIALQFYGIYNDGSGLKRIALSNNSGSSPINLISGTSVVKSGALSLCNYGVNPMPKGIVECFYSGSSSTTRENTPEFWKEEDFRAAVPQGVTRIGRAGSYTLTKNRAFGTTLDRQASRQDFHYCYGGSKDVGNTKAWQANDWITTISANWYVVEYLTTQSQVIQQINYLGIPWCESLNDVLTYLDPNDPPKTLHVPKIVGNIPQTEDSTPDSPDWDDTINKNKNNFNATTDMTEREPNPDPLGPTVTPPPVGPNPRPQPDPNIDVPEESDVDLDDSIISNVKDVGTTKYCMGETTLSGIRQWLNSTYAPDNETFISDFKGTNPADYIASIMVYPFEPNRKSTSSTVIVGKISTSLSAYELNNGVEVIDLGDITVNPTYNDFRDFKPYTQMRLYIPYCGTVDIDPAIYTGHNLGVRIIVDYHTGNAVASIERDGYSMDTVNGQIGANVPMTSIAQGNFQQYVSDAQTALIGAKQSQRQTFVNGAFKISESAVQLNAAGVASGVYNTAESMLSSERVINKQEWDIEHAPISAGEVSTASPMGFFGLDNRAHLLVNHVSSLGFSSAAYGHTVGYACMISGKLSSFSGYTVFSNVDLSGVVATSGEKDMILSLLANGVII